MLISAVWLLEAEYKFGKKHFRYTRSDPTKMSGYEAAAVMVLGSAVAVQSTAVTMMPYYGLYKAHGAASGMKATSIRGFRISSPGFKAVPYGFSTRRLLAAKVASRFIPYAGWALLAYDVYSVGKWAHEKWA